MLDTGADINVIKLNAVKPNIHCTPTDNTQITGTTDGTIKTLGSVNVQIGNSWHVFHLVDNSFPIKEDGILGTKFLYTENATISFGTGTITTDNCKPLKILDENIVSIPSRTGKVISLKVANPTLKTGFIDNIDLGPSIFLGKALVTNRNGLAYAYVINSSETAVKIRGPVVTLEEVDKPEDLGSQLTDTRLTSVQSILLTKARENNTNNTSRTLHFSPNYDSERLHTLMENLRLNHLNDEEKQSITDLAIEFNHLFFLPGDKLKHTQLVSHTIPTTDDIPIHTKQYRYPQIHKEEINTQVNKLLDQHIIKHSSSPYNSPVWIVPKKTDAAGNKKWRMVIDFRKLNEKTVGDAYPLPNITDILDQLGSAKYFSKFDLASGFHQIPMHPDHSPKTAFSTPHGHYEYNRMPFGLKNAPSTF